MCLSFRLRKTKIVGLVLGKCGRGGSSRDKIEKNKQGYHQTMRTEHQFSSDNDGQLPPPDRLATREEFMFSYGEQKKYEMLLEDPEFSRLEKEGIFLVKKEYENDDQGRRRLSYLEIRDKDNGILFLADFSALRDSAIRHGLSARHWGE
jgi:hypothetical protein